MATDAGRRVGAQDFAARSAAAAVAATPSGFVGTTFEVAVDIFTQLRGSLGHEWDLLMLSLGSAILYKATKAL